tara:strand:- start:2407 stop:5721 length:3315 start_codon:yes stop_codon:yes gene_type:complete
MSKDRKSRNLFKRLTRLFRSGPVVKRKIVNVDNKYTATAFEAFRKNQSQIYSNAMSNYGTYDRMARYSDFCFRGDTLVYTTDGVYTFKELSEKYSSGERFHVYSYDPIDKTIKISTAHSPRVTRDGTNQKLVRIKFDDGGHVDVTPDHQVMLRSGKEVKARELNAGDSLMPFYVKDINGFGYDFIYTMDRERCKGGWLTEHLVVAEYFAGRQIKKGEEEVHHIDFDRKNNHVTNLKIMDIFEHKKYHAQLNNKNKFCKPNHGKSRQMFENNPVSRNDLTLDRILDVALEVDFSLKEVSRILGADYNTIKRRLNRVGIKNWKELNKNRTNIQDMRTHLNIISETSSPEIDVIKKEGQNVDTLYELSVKLKCTKNAISRRLYSDGYDNWSHFRESIGLGKRYVGKKRGPTSDNSFSYQDVCNSYKKGMTKLELAKSVGASHNKVMTKIHNAGFRSYTVWCDNFNNHKVASINYLDDEEIVYNVTVDNYHNLAVGSLNPNNDDGSRSYSMIIAMQSEMEYTPEISSALDIYSEEAIAADESGTTLHIFSENSKIKELLHELFYDTLNVEFNMSSWVRNLVKYGDHFMFNDVDPNYGVIAAYPLPISEVEREEGYDPNDPMAVRFRWIRENQLLENWQVSHMRLLANDAFLPYGSSVLEPARRIWRQLILLEDAMLIHRVVRAPGRRVFYIDVGNVPPEDVANYMEQAQTSLKRSSIVDKQTGKVDLRYNPISIDEDYFVPVRGSDSGTKIDTLEGTSIQGETSDVEYIQRKLFAALKIPKAYLGYDEGLGAKSTLSQEDVRFSRTIARIQRTVLAELNKIAIIHLYCNGYDGEDLLDFKLMLSNPSTIAQQQKLELWKQRFDAAGSALGTGGVVDIYWVQKHLLSLSDDDIDMINKGRKADKVLELEIDSTQITSLEGPENSQGGMPQFDFDNVEGLPSASGPGGGGNPETSLPSLDIGDMSEQSSLENEDYPIIVDGIMKNSLSILDEDDQKEEPPKKDDRSNKSYLRTGENTKLNVRNRDKLSNPGFDKLAYERKQDIHPKISEDFDINEYLEEQTIYSARMTGQIKKTLNMLGNMDDIYKRSNPKNKSVIISENNSSGDEDDET